MKPLGSFVDRWVVSMMVASFLASCATARVKDDPFDGFFVGEHVQLVSKAVLYDCGKKRAPQKCLGSIELSDGSVAGVEPYSGTARFEVVDRDRYFEADVWVTSIRVREVDSSKSYWVAGFKELFEKSSHR